MTPKKRHSHYKDVFGSEVGKEVLMDLCKEASVMKPTFDLNPYAAAYNEGRRAMALFVLKYVTQDPHALYAEIIRHNQQETTNE
jgi:hypothetical protein